MYKKAEDGLVEGFESADLQRNPRKLRKVDTEELDFKAFRADLGQGQRKKQKGKAQAKMGGS
jgi:hypothetical protein